jgi:uroporphyrinogen-III synthase
MIKLTGGPYSPSFLANVGLQAACAELVPELQRSKGSAMGENENSNLAAPLAGWRILVSRARDQAGALTQGLRACGAEVLEIPFIEIRPPRSFKSLDESLKVVSEYEWLILTSVNGVRAMFERMALLNLPRRVLSHLNIVAIGPATRAAIEQEGLKVALTPKAYVAESLVEALGEKVRGRRVLLCRAKIARDVIPVELRHAGAFLDVAEAYENVIPQSSRVALRAVLRDPQRRPHLITFTSSSTVQNYVALLGIRSGRSHLVEGVLNASIGSITSQTLRLFQLSVDVEASDHTIPGLIDAIVNRATSSVSSVSQSLPVAP